MKRVQKIRIGFYTKVSFLMAQAISVSSGALRFLGDLPDFSGDSQTTGRQKYTNNFKSPWTYSKGENF